MHKHDLVEGLKERLQFPVVVVERNVRSGVPEERRYIPLYLDEARAVITMLELDDEHHHLAVAALSLGG